MVRPAPLAPTKAAPSQAMRPMPIRLTPLQLAMLHRFRAHDSISVQEHIRRAVDGYIEFRSAKYGMTISAEIQPAAVAPEPGKRKLDAPIPHVLAQAPTSSVQRRDPTELLPPKRHQQVIIDG